MTTADTKRQLGKRTVKRGIVEIYSGPLNLYFRCPLTDPRSARLESIVLGFEQAAQQRAKQKRLKHGDTSALS